MVYSNQLQRNTGIVDPLVFSRNISDSIFIYQGYGVGKNHYQVLKDLPAENLPANPGGTTNFKIPITGDKLGPIQLIFDTSAISVTPVGGAPALTAASQKRFVDFMGYNAWEKIELRYGTNILYTLTPEECFYRYKYPNSNERKVGLADLIGGELPSSVRNEKALSTQRFIVDLPFPHSRGTSRWIELMQLAQEIRIEITWRKANETIQLENIDTTTYTYNINYSIPFVNLRHTIVYLDGDERDANTQRTETEDGIIRIYEDWKFEKQVIRKSDIVAGNDLVISIKNFRSSEKTFGFFIRRLLPELQTDYKRVYTSNFCPVEDWNLEGADGKIIEKRSGRYTTHHLQNLYHSCAVDQTSSGRIYEQHWATMPDDLLNASGSYQFGTTTNISLRFNVDTDDTEVQRFFESGSDYEIYMFTREYNFHQHVRGDLQTSFK